MQVRKTNGNGKNGIKGSLLKIYGGGRLIDSFTIPTRNGTWYCEQYPGGKYGRRYHEAVERAREADIKAGYVKIQDQEEE